MMLNNKQWALLSPYIPVYQQTTGRPRTDSRKIFEAILYILKTGAPWRSLPSDYPPYQTVHRYFREWTKGGVISNALECLTRLAEAKGKLKMRTCYIDGSLVRSRGGADGVGWNRNGKSVKLQAICDNQGMPVSLIVMPGNPHEITMTDIAIESRLTLGLPKYLGGDLGYDSDVLHERLKENYDIWLTTNHRKNRKRAPRKRRSNHLKVLKGRYKIERLFSWIKQYRRCATRFDAKASSYEAFLQLACLLIITRRVLRR